MSSRNTAIDIMKISGAIYLWLFLMIIGVAANTYGWKWIFIEGSIGRGMFSFFAGAVLAKNMRQAKRKKIGCC